MDDETNPFGLLEAIYQSLFVDFIQYKVQILAINDINESQYTDIQLHILILRSDYLYKY
jgi:hypothetical protein